MSTDETGQLAFHWRVYLLLFAAVGTVIANFRGIDWFLVFPEGLLRVLPARHLWNLYVFILIGDEDVFITVGWCIYFALVALLLYVQSRRTFFIVFILLCSLLMFNTVGCRKEFPLPF